ncbi:nitrite reductase small subunit NirD [Haloechinothrix sp. LS1_15]|uniref:nitrite reductase small subunit NirD n=1 Tax=Haloechinothrix sp. LS1_15 TaxID=2652248 RepID=UPI0029477141|nr:nitrite reductase small subunit NirD [Haloechinothrix sp. LS1_15]MDV6013851.1 nitrite reductase small subunit NirD [Haloechinothrix sp. LS1_15]
MNTTRAGSATGETGTDERDWTPVCLLEQIEEHGGVAALLPGGEQVAVFRLPGDEVYALSHIDPFSGAAVLARGIVGDTLGIPTVASPLHKQQFDLRTGRCLDDESVRVASYQVHIDGGIVAVGGRRR